MDTNISFCGASVGWGCSRGPEKDYIAHTLDGCSDLGLQKQRPPPIRHSSYLLIKASLACFLKPSSEASRGSGHCLALLSNQLLPVLVGVFLRLQVHRTPQVSSVGWRMGC